MTKPEANRLKGAIQAAITNLEDGHVVLAYRALVSLLKLIEEFENQVKVAE